MSSRICCQHLSKSLLLTSPRIEVRSWSMVLMLCAPTIAVWKTSALATMAIAIREVCSPSSWWRACAMSSSAWVPAVSRSLPAASPMLCSRMDAPLASSCSDRETFSMQLARSSILPASQPVAGQRTAGATSCSEYVQ